MKCAARVLDFILCAHMFFAFGWEDAAKPWKGSDVFQASEEPELNWVYHLGRRIRSLFTKGL